MPFKYWEDDHTKLIRRTKPPEFVDPIYYHKAHIRSDDKWPHSYFLNKKCWKLMRDHGPFVGKYKDCEELVDKHCDEVAWIICPGPSLSRFKLDRLSDALSIAVNSAGFAFEPSYWCMAESGYAKWLLDQRYPLGSNVLATARVAVILREAEIKSGRDKFASVHVLRWEEEYVVPPRTPAVSITNALVTAWQMGCRRAHVVGLDLHKEPRKPYAKGLPHTREGAENPFDDQIRALKQFKLPGFEVINCSPFSRHTLSNFEYIDMEELCQNI